MKTIITLIYIAGFQCLSFAQTKPTVPQPLNANNTTTGVRFCISPVNSEELKPEYLTSSEAKEIIIKGIPVSEKALASINIEFDMLGSFAFKKDESLAIPFSQEVFIEDKLTGKIFNLKTPAAYKFNVDKWVPNRFVLHILDKTNPETLTASK